MSHHYYRYQTKKKNKQMVKSLPPVPHTRRAAALTRQLAAVNKRFRAIALSSLLDRPVIATIS